jgi:hypothetical protein
LAYYGCGFHHLSWVAGGELHLMAPKASRELLLPIGAANLRGEAFLFGSSYPLRCLTLADIREQVVAAHRACSIRVSSFRELTKL